MTFLARRPGSLCPSALCAITFLLLLATSVARGQVLVLSNVTETFSAGSWLNVNATQWLGQPFTTGSSSFTLNSVSMEFVAGGTSTGFAFRLYTAGVGQPGTLLETLTPSANPNTGGTITFTSTNSTQLDANTSYWVVASVTSTQAARANMTSSTGETSAYGWTFSDIRYQSANSGASWATRTTFPRLSITATASAIPEPSTYAALAGVAVLGLAVYRRRRTA